MDDLAKIMTALRAADAAGDVEGAKRLAAMAKEKRQAVPGNAPAPVAAPVEPASPRMPNTPAMPGGFDPIMTAMAAEPLPQNLPPADFYGSPMGFGMMGGMDDSWARAEAQRIAATETAPLPDPHAARVEPPTPDPFAGEGFGALAKRRYQQVARGAAEVVASVPEGVAILDAHIDREARKGAATLIPDAAALEAEALAFEAELPNVPEEQRAFLEEQIQDLRSKAHQRRLLADTPSVTKPVTPASERPTFALGDDVRQFNEWLYGAPDPRDESFWGKVAEGGGNMAAMATIGYLTGGLSGSGMVGAAAGGGLGASMNSAQVYKEAKQAGSSEETALRAAGLAGVVGAGEIVPIGRALKLLPSPLRDKLSGTIYRRVGEIALGAGEEAAQEGLSQVMNNLIASGLYDPERGWSDDLTESMLVGAVLGGGMGAAGSMITGDETAAQPEAGAPPVQPAQAPPPAPEAAPPLALQPERRVDLPAPPVAPVAPQQEVPPSQPEAQPEPEAARAATAGPVIPAPASGRTSITPEEAAADPERYEILDESEGVGGEWRATGRQIARDKTTGEMIPVVAGRPGGAGDTGPQPQAEPAPDRVPVPEPPAADPIAAAMAPETVPEVAPPPADPIAAAMAPQPPAAAPEPPARRPNQPDNVEFIDERGVQAIGTEPGVMQYKGGGDEQGVTDRLKGVKEWRPERAGMSIIYEYEDGRRVIADGHQRLGLAKRLASEGKPVQMPAMILRQRDGISPQEARTIAAMKNIAEGSGTAVDAAKVLRDSDRTPEQMGLPPSSALVRDATGLRNLSTDAFGMVINGVSSERDGGIVGRIVTDKAAQANILGLLNRLKPANAFQAESIARQAAADTVTETQDSLFGPEADTQNLYLERARILDAASKRVREDLKTFRTLVDRAETVQGAGNVLNADENARRLASDAAVRDYLSSEANTKGPISDALTAAARALKGGAKPGQVVSDFLATVERELGSRRGDSETGGGTRPADGSGRRESVEPQAVEAGQDADAASADLFAPEQTGRTPDQQRAEAEAEVKANQSKIRTSAPQADAGPLFNPQDDLFDAPKQPEATAPGDQDLKRQQGEALIEKGRQLIGPFRRDGDDTNPNPNAADISGTEEAISLAADLAQAKTAAARQKIAEKWVLVQGKKTGLEHLVVLDQDGTPLSITKGAQRNVAPPPAVFRAGMDGLVALSIHNHPSSNGFSAADMAMLAIWPEHRMVVLAHDGTTHEATSGPVRLMRPPKDMDANRWGTIRDALEAVWSHAVHGLMTKAQAIGDADHGEARWKKATQPAFALFLDRLGVIRYNDRSKWQDHFAATGFDFEAIYGSGTGAFTDRLGRAGFDISKIGDRGRNQAPSGRSATAPSPSDKATGRSAENRAAGDGQGRVQPEPVTGDTDFDGALDALFGKEGSDVSGTGNDLERDRGDAVAADGLGTADVPAAGGRPAAGTAKRGRSAGRRDQQQGAGRSLPDGDAAPVGASGDPGVSGGERGKGQPADRGKPRRGDGSGERGLPAKPGRTGGAAPDAAGQADLDRADADLIGQLFKEEGALFREAPGFHEDAAGIDPQKMDALRAIFDRRLAGVDMQGTPRQQVFVAMMKPLIEAGVTRDQMVAMKPYFDHYLNQLAQGRSSPAPKPAPTVEAAAQASADRPRIVASDRANIDRTLPQLLPEQRDDVFKVETRFAKPDGHGFMLTNGTGTGKTFSGGGVVKRFFQQGKKDVLIVAPSDAVIAGWLKALETLGVPARQLANVKDAGAGVVLTTYANLEQNKAVAGRSWDLVVTDEAQHLSSNQNGDPTGALQTIRAISHRPEDLWRKSQMLHDEDWAKFRAMKDGEAKSTVYRRLKDREEREVAAWSEKPRSKVLFLSATPFAYDKSIDYAEGYLFDYQKDGHVGRSRQSGQSLFMVENFGYRIRYHKLTRPEAAVDSAVFEREFHQKLVRDGVLSGRSLQVDVDYDRRFVTVADAVGEKIDAVLKDLSEGGRSADKALADGYRTLSKRVSQQFNHLKRMQLLEAIKARAAVPDIQKHLALGRKVVVFHDYNVGGGFNPFAGVVPADDSNAIAAMADLMAKHPDLQRLDFAGYGAPADTLSAAFGSKARLFNGTVPKAKRLKHLAEFNADGSGADVLIVQADAGGAGISMHDTTGAHQRVLINLGMPNKPTTTLQQEGRILRVGSASNAPFRYYTIGTAWERRAFAQKIAERSGTVENLALGNEARAITDGFINAYIEAEAIEPSAADGIGGKERDRRANTTSPFQMAISHYFGRMKIAGRRDRREGLDFYPTPEPLAFKMVEWAGIRPNERVLEPSAGDGAIARYMPEGIDLTMVEPSMDLASRAQLRAPGGKVVESTFENFHLVNKAHVVVMNPPFGQGGATAMAHLAKAARHLRPAGRIVALIPSGPSADKRFDTWFHGDDAKDLHLTAEVALPAVAFERAGTKVMTRVVVIDKPANPDQPPPEGKRINFTGAGSIKDFFERLEGYEVPRRPEAAVDAVTEIEAEGEAADTPRRASMQPAAPLGAKVDFKTKDTTHGKTGAPLFVASPAARVERADYDKMLAVAKSHGGYYSSFRGAGAVPGFQFKTEAARQAFLDDMAKPVVGMEEAISLYQRQPLQLERAIIGGDLGSLSGHRDYAAAKAGDVDAAVRVAQDVVTEDLVARVREAIGNSHALIVPVVSEEAAGRNKIPLAAAEVLAARLGIDAVADIVQANAPKRTALAGLDRIFASPVFDGAVIAGQEYLILDDTLTQGGTFAALAGHIEAGGGQVVAAVALTGKQYSAKLRLEPETLSALREKHGDLEQDFIAATGYGFDSLTESEARYLTNFKPTDAVRARILEEGRSRSASSDPGADPAVERPEERRQMIVGAATAAAEIKRLMPALRAELDRLDLKRVRLSLDNRAWWQGKFEVTGAGAMEITIGASLDPMKTLHHEVIHALRALNLFTPEEWRALEMAAVKDWIEKHDIPNRYPDLPLDMQIEEAIAEEFSQALEQKRSPKGSLLVTAFNKIARFLRALRNVFNGAGFQTPEDIFGRVLAGEIGKRQQPGFHAAQDRFQRPRVARPQTAQGRANQATAMQGAIFVPDRRVWEELRRAGVPIWQRLRNGRAAARDAVDRARALIQDRMLPVLRAQRVIEESAGARLPDEMNVYAAETTYSGKVGRHLFEIDEEYTKPVIDLIAETRGALSVDDVGTWLYARHAIERNARIAQINLEMPDGGSGMTNDEARAILAQAAAGPHADRLRKIGELIDHLRDRTLRLRENAGLITHEEADMWRQMYRHYVPLKGWAETDHSDGALDLAPLGRRLNVRGPETRRALGRRSEAFNPLQASFTQAQETAIRAEKNRVGQALYELAKEHPSEALWTVKRPEQKRYYNRTTGLVETRVANPVEVMLAPDELAVKVGGQETRIKIHDPRIAKAVSGVGADQMGSFIRFIAPLTRWFSMARTMLNPEFVITNAVRDFETAQINVLGMSVERKTRIAKAMATNWRKAFAGALRGAGGKADTEWSKHYRDFQSAGAQVSFWTIEQPEAGKADLEKRIRLKRGNAAMRGLKRLTALNMRDNILLSSIERVNLAVDNAIRLAAFVEAKKQGMSVQDAAFLSKELTVNFNRRGEYGPTLNVVYPFFNAATQGTVRLLQAMRNPKLFVGMTVGGIGLGLILDLVNAALSEEDDDGELLYDKIPDYRNRRHLHFVGGSDGSDAWAVPLAYGYNIFPYAGQQLGKVIRGVKQPDDALADVGATFLQAYMPTESLVPGLVAPAFEIAENKNYFGSSIYPEDFYGSNKYLPDASKYFPSATGASVWVAKTLNELSGGNAVTSGWMDFSPEVIDYMSAFVVGSAGAFYGRSFDTLGKVMAGKTDDIEEKDIPFWRTIRSNVSPWVDKDRYRTFGAEVRDAKHDVDNWPAGSTPPADVVAKAGLYDFLLQAERERKSQGEFNQGGRKFARLPRDERAVIMEFNKKFLSVAGKRAE